MKKVLQEKVLWEYFQWLKLLIFTSFMFLSAANVVLLVQSGKLGHALVFAVCSDRFLSLFLAPLGTRSNLFLPKLFYIPFSNASQARRELRRLKEEARNKHAIAVIWAFWLGYKVLHVHISHAPPHYPTVSTI